MVRYTPLLQPQVANESITGAGGTITVVNSRSKTSDVYINRVENKEESGACNIELCLKEIKTWDEVTKTISYIYNDEKSILEDVKSYDLNFYYP